MSDEHVIETDLPLAFLVGQERRTQPGHPSPLAQRGVTGMQGGRLDGQLRHVSNTATYGDGYRTLARVNRPGWDGAGPRAALCDLMLRIAVNDYPSFSESWDACHGELEEAAHDFRPAALRVNGVDYPGWELFEKGVVARAAIVAGGWTVLASVLEGQELAVELELLDAQAVAA